MSERDAAGTTSYERDPRDQGAAWWLVTVTRSTVYRVCAASSDDATDAVLDGGGKEVDELTDGTEVERDIDQTEDGSGDDACPECERSNGPSYSGPCPHGGR